MARGVGPRSAAARARPSERGAALPKIAAITGHLLRPIHQILQHYLAITPELADSAIAKLAAFVAEGGL